MKFQQIRSATSIVTFGGKRFLIDPMLSDQGHYPSVPETTDTGRGNPDCNLPLINFPVFGKTNPLKANDFLPDGDLASGADPLGAHFLVMDVACWK